MVVMSQPCGNGAQPILPPGDEPSGARKTEFQRFADARVSPEYRQPLKTAEEAMRAVGWAVEDHPSCCGSPVKIRGFLGCADFAQCETCKRFIARANAPQFGNAWVDLPTIDEPEDGRVWIAGVEAHDTSSATDPLRDANT